MVESNSIEDNSFEASNDQQQFKLNKINEIKEYFIAEIKEKQLMTKKFSKYMASFDYFDKSLIFLSATSLSISIASFATVIGTPVGIARASFSLAFLLSTGLEKKLLNKKIQQEEKNNKKKHNKTVMLARSNLNSIESKICHALINNKISHEDFTTIVNEERNYRGLKQSIKMTVKKTKK